jgi:hypothetical protein
MSHMTYGSSRRSRAIASRSRSTAMSQNGLGTGGACTWRIGVVVAVRQAGSPAYSRNMISY